jgi:flagellar basal body-associated protein FliL
MEKNKNGIVAIIVILIVMLLALTVGFVYMITLINKTSAGNTQTTKVMAEYKLEDVAVFALKDSIKANLLPTSSDSKDHMAMITISIGLNTKEKDYKTLSPMLTEKEVIIRDAILKILRNKTYEELNKADAQSMLRAEILNCLQELFNSNTIVDVYFGEFYKQ